MQAWRSTVRPVLAMKMFSIIPMILFMRFLVFAAAAEKTNIVLLLADDLGYGSPEYQSVDLGKGARTPHLNEMAVSASTLRFSNFHSTSTTCSPTRSSLLSGRDNYQECVAGANVQNQKVYQAYADMYPFRNGMGSIARSAKAAGYATAFFGKWHLGGLPRKGPGMMGFDTWAASKTNIVTYDPYCFLPELRCLRSKGCGRKKTADKCYRPPRQRFCFSKLAESTCYFGHFPRKGSLAVIPPELMEPTPGQNVSSPQAKIRLSSIQRGSPLADALVTKFETFARQVPLAQPIFAYLWFYEPHHPFIAAPELNTQCLNGTVCMTKYNSSQITAEVEYYSVIVQLDLAVGRIRNLLKDIGRYENTLLIFTSDNGGADPVREQTAASSGPFKGWKLQLFEGSHRVPALMEWPARIKSNVEIKEIASTVDLYRTFNDIFLSELGEPVDLPSKYEREPGGVSLFPLLTSEDPSTWVRSSGIGICQPKYLRTEPACKDFAYRWKNWRLTGPLQRNINLYSNRTLNLYDLDTDPKETTNLALNRSDVLELIMPMAVSWVTNVTTEYFKYCKF